MKYFKIKNEYKNSTGTNKLYFNEDGRPIAVSYGWWVYFKDGVFNHSYYSQTTCKHQSKVNDLLKDLGISVDLRLTRTKLSLTNLDAAISDESALITLEIKTLEEKFSKLKKKDGPRAEAYSNRLDDLRVQLRSVFNYKMESKYL